jgi:hypothetical protein
VSGRVRRGRKLFRLLPSYGMAFVMTVARAIQLLLKTFCGTIRGLRMISSLV